MDWEFDAPVRPGARRSFVSFVFFVAEEGRARFVVEPCPGDRASEFCRVMSQAMDTKCCRWYRCAAPAGRVHDVPARGSNDAEVAACGRGAVFGRLRVRPAPGTAEEV